MTEERKLKLAIESTKQEIKVRENAIRVIQEEIEPYLYKLADYERQLDALRKQEAAANE